MDFEVEIEWKKDYRVFHHNLISPLREFLEEKKALT
jgi:hypothetical protein